MNLLNNMILNIILTIFPLLIYFLYNCYRELKCEKYNSILLNIALFTSVYLCTKYGNIKTNPEILLYCNIPVLIAYLKRQPQVAMILSIFILLYTYLNMPSTIMIEIIKFISYLIIYLIGRRKQIKDNTFIILIAILQVFFLSLEYTLYYHTNSFKTVIQLVIFLLLFYILPIIILYLFKITENITSLYQNISELEKEKQLRNSFFKITHEVKNPIAVCKGYLEMLNPKNQDQINRYIPIIKQEIDRSLSIMTDFMEFSKIKIDNELLDINILLEDVIDKVNFLALSKNIKLSYTLIDDDIYINGDYNRLKQVFINIVKNSMEAINEKGQIQINSYINSKYYYIEIIDNGCGMDKETLSKIKEMFYTTKKQGSGLGVSLSNEIIKAHKGSINYKSKLGKGTKTIVKLPISML